MDEDDSEGDNKVTLMTVHAAKGLEFETVFVVGIDELKETILEMFFGGHLSFNDEVVITNERHKQCLEKAHESLKLFQTSLEMGYPEDICAIDLTDAISSLGEITGETMREDLIDEIFGKFCMGK